MPLQDLLAIVLGLSLSGIWLMYKLDQFQWVPKINDPKGIIIPSFVFLLSPFLAVWIMPAFISGDVNEIIKPILPLVTFILGQTITKREKQKEENQQKISLVKMMIYNLETNAIELLFKIDRQLMRSLQNDEENVISDEIKHLHKELKLEIEKLHERLSFQLDIIKIGGGIEFLIYVEKIKNEAKRMESNLESGQLNQEYKLSHLSEIRSFVINSYENIIYLIKESITNDEKIYAALLDNCALKLNQERERLMQLMRCRKSIKLKSEERNSIVELNSQFDMYSEDDAIQKIESLLQHFDMPIKTVDLD